MYNGQKPEDVLTRLADDNTIALEEIYTYFYPRLYNFSRSFLKLEDGIDDILQEVFVRIWQNRKKLKNPETFNAYVFTITRNLLLNELRNRLNQKRIKEKIQSRAVTEEFMIMGKTDVGILARQVDQIVEGLSPRQREIFRMSRSEGLSYREIAQSLNIAEKTVEYHITQALAVLKRKMKELGLLQLLYLIFFC